MSDAIFRTLIATAPEIDDAKARYREGLVSSYVQRGTQVLLAAHALASREHAARVFHQQLMSASVLFCKAVRVAQGVSATRSVDLAALVAGGVGVNDPLPSCDEHAQLTLIANLAARCAVEPARAAEWLRELDLLVERTEGLRAQPRPARRATPRPATRPVAPAPSVPDPQAKGRR
jgi:hypothetical protein